MDNNDLEQFCLQLPKVELHAHLNTSYSIDCLHKLIALKGDTWEHALEELYISANKEMDESFKCFRKVQKLVTTEEAVYLLTYNVIKEYAEENVKYLELRSTPKEIPETGMTQELYMRTMIRAVQDCEKERLDIIVRLLVSIDRRHGVRVAEITVDLAEKLMCETNGLVLGIDFSGDPTVGNAADYIPVFLDAGRRGLKLSLHLAEIPQFEETLNVLKACCESCVLRIGHGTYLHRCHEDQSNGEIVKLVVRKKIPVEACLTSNLLTKTVDCLEQHHFKFWFDQNHPVILCADGKGVYNCTLTQEFVKAATTYRWSKHKLKEYVVGTIDFIFGGEDIKKILRDKFQKFEEDSNTQ